MSEFLQVLDQIQSDNSRVTSVINESGISISGNKSFKNKPQS